MESLVANYASSDEEEEVKPQRSLPKPSLLSLPPPKSQQQRRIVQFKPSISLPTNNIADDEDEEEEAQIPKASPLNLPPPKSQQTRRIVQFRPPISLPTNNIEDDEEEEEKQRERKRRRESQSRAVPSGKSVLSMIPPPKHSLSLGSSSSSARRVSIPKDPSPPKLVAAPEPPKLVEDLEPSSVNYYGGNVYSGYMESESVGIEEVVPEMGREMGRRGGKAKIVEVKQDELMKNRPHQDPTPAAASFGPAYPAVSAKGKPTKLHKRKHQIGSLYFDMRQKESELAERRSKGFLTKAETQAKYGW